MGSLLPLPVVLALLRILRGREPEPGDEDALFDEFGCAGSEQVLVRAMRVVCGAGMQQRRWELQCAQIEATLVEMMRDHAGRRMAA